MKIVTNEESRRWCKENGLEIERPHRRDPRICNGTRFLTEAKASIAEALVRNTIANRRFSRGLVWILDWPLYKPDEMAVVKRLRSSIGESRSLIDAPGHIFDAEEVDDCIGLFNLCVQYFWMRFC